MENYIAMLLVVAPGFIARNIYERLNSGEKEKSDFRRTVIALLHSIPIVVISLVVVVSLTEIETIPQLMKSMEEIRSMLKYTALMLMVTALYVTLLSIVHPKYTTMLANFIRKYRGLSEVSQEDDAWNIMFNNNESQPVAIFKDGKQIACGLVKNWNHADNEEKELILEGEWIEEHLDEDDVTRTYYSLDKDILIKEYSLEELHSKLKQKNSTG